MGVKVILNYKKYQEEKMIKYILASNSPRRRELLEQVGLRFEVIASHGEEVITRQSPHEIVEELSLQKAMEVSQKYMQRGLMDKNDTIVVIGADTIVAYNGTIMGKPKNEEDAARMLTLLQGKTHQVYTGVTLIIIVSEGQKNITFHEKTSVSLYPISSERISDYIATGEPMDKAGAYAIQGRFAAYVKGINGDYNNVVGLPVARLMNELFSLKLA